MLKPTVETKDAAEQIRRVMAHEFNSNPRTREELEKTGVKVWDTEELTRDFEVQGFYAPLVVVKDRRTGKVGTVFFQHQPRLYFDFEEKGVGV